MATVKGANVEVRIPSTTLSVTPPGFRNEQVGYQALFLREKRGFIESAYNRTMPSVASAVLIAHSWLRWIVLLSALAVVFRAVGGLRSTKLWGASDQRGLKIFIAALDIQTLLGLILYVGVSPVIAGAFQNIAAAMRNGVLRFFLVEHLFGMLIAVAVAHVGSVKVRKAIDSSAKHRLALVYVLVALAVILLSIPWPGTPADRPLFRFSATQ
jgi:hypothetical protein